VCEMARAVWQREQQRWPRSEKRQAEELAEAIRRVLAHEHVAGCKRREYPCKCWLQILEAAWKDWCLDHPDELI
jgi:hypothetical protein